MVIGTTRCKKKQPSVPFVICRASAMKIPMRTYVTH